MVLYGGAEGLEIGLDGRHEDHVVEDDDVVPLLADLHPVDQFLV